MTDTEEDNKLIAEFMAIKLDGEYHLLRHGWCMIGDMQYHTSWDWLMPVVERIEAIKDSDEYEVDIFGNCCDIGGKIEIVGKTKIEAAWRAVVAFIQWYNKHKEDT